ncbi:MAG: hypothetical protein IKK33_09105 [Lachnospiraceae bacterium]|nr:hypothetical protein [Lachnospiraceae bacterium]
MKKIHKLDLILLIGIGLIAIVSAIIDIFYVVVFPVCSCASVFYVSYPLWIILLIYSSINYKGKEEQEKPQYIKWYMLFLLPFLHIAFVLVGFIIGIGLKNLFQL